MVSPTVHRGYPPKPSVQDLIVPFGGPTATDEQMSSSSDGLIDPMGMLTLQTDKPPQPSSGAIDGIENARAKPLQSRHRRSPVQVDMGFRAKPVELYEKFIKRMSAVEFHFPGKLGEFKLGESKDTWFHQLAVTGELKTKVKKDEKKRTFPEVTAFWIASKKDEIMNTITQDMGHKTALNYLKNGGMILEPILERLKSIRNRLVYRPMEQKKISPFEVNFSKVLRNLYRLEVINDEEIKEGMNLNTFLDHVLNIKKEQRPYWKIIRHAFGDTKKERGRVFECLRSYCELR